MLNGISKPNPFPKSIFENVAYGLKVNGISDKKYIAERVEQSLIAAALWNEVKINFISQHLHCLVVSNKGYV